VANLWLREDSREPVYAVTRNLERADPWRRSGITPIVADILDPASLRFLPAAETVLFAVGYDPASAKSIEEVYVGGLENVMAALAQLTSRLKRFIYISSTGVYGQVDGDVVNEDSPCQPTRAGGVACLAAERLLQTVPLAKATMILRLAGIYGPGRVPRLADIRAGEPIAAPSEGLVNLIHVDDAAAIVVAAERQIAPPGLFVVSDGQPVSRGEYYGEVARLLHAPPPRFTPPPAEAHVAQRAGSDKRVDPARLFAALSLRLRYPTYREGLAAILADPSH
jgi:nucleoside-diphosphate-sugar epimerase